nr:heavy metal-binding domain-containing protein [Zavarzinella formosa]
MKIPLSARHHGGALVIDPVCGMSVDPASAVGEVTHEGTRHFFCSASCEKKFVADPQQFLQPPQGHRAEHSCCHGTDTAPPAMTIPAVSGAVEHTCPMHPEIRQPGPGVCPKCGMALEPADQSMTKVEYVCPMHPEVVSDHPGPCPKCGMALEPRTPAASWSGRRKSGKTRFWRGLSAWSARPDELAPPLRSSWTGCPDSLSPP